MKLIDKFNCNDIKDIFLTIIQLVSMALCTTILIISRYIYYDSEVSMSLSEEFIINFKEGYYTSFQACNSPYKSVNLQNRLGANYHISFGTWQGTVTGCGSNETGRNRSKILEEGKKCGEKEVLLDGIPPQELYSFKGISLCGTSKGNYYDLLKENGTIISKEDSCPGGKRSCGYIDTLNNKLCVNENEECPVSYIKISDKKPEKVKNLIEISFDNTDKKFYYSTNPYENTTDIPYIQYTFKIADSYICTLPNLYYSSITLFELDAFKKEYSSNCVLKDYSQDITKDILLRYHLIDQINNYELYEENKIIEKIQNSKLIYYGYNINNYKNNMLSLYIRTHFGFNYTCLEKMNFNIDNLYIFNGQADKMNTWSKHIWWTFSNLIFSLTEIVTFFPAEDKKIILEMFIKYAFMIIPSIGLLDNSLRARCYDDSFEKEMKCSDIITNSNYNIMIKKLRRSGVWIKITSRCIIALVISDVFSFIIRLYSFYSLYKRRKKVQYLPQKKQKKVEDWLMLQEIDYKWKNLIPDDEEGEKKEGKEVDGEGKLEVNNNQVEDNLINKENELKENEVKENELKENELKEKEDKKENIEIKNKE